MSDNVWQESFDRYAPQYEDEVFTKGTEGEAHLPRPEGT